MHIIWHYPHFKFHAGGTRFLAEISNYLTFDSRRMITFIVNQSDDKFVKAHFSKEIDIINTNSTSTNNLIYWLIFPFFLTKDFFQTLYMVKKSNTDVLFATLFPSNFIMACISKITHRPFYHYCYEPFPFLQNKDFINTFPHPKRLLLKILRVMYAPLDSWASRQAVKTFTLNQITQQMIKDVYGVNSIVTLMGVDSKHFSPQKSKKYQQMYNGRSVIAHSTDYTTMKNTDLAIKIMSQLIKTHPKAVLLVTSTRPNAPEKKNLISLVDNLGLNDNVIFLDLIDYNDLPILYSNAVCYLSCSTDKMLGTTSSNLPVKEAMACGTPALRANITTEDVVDGYSGFLIDPRESLKVAKKIGYLIDNPKTAKKMGLEGRKRIVKEYKWQHVADIIIREIGA